MGVPRGVATLVTTSVLVDGRRDRYCLLGPRACTVSDSQASKAKAALDTLQSRDTPLRTASAVKWLAKNSPEEGLEPVLRLLAHHHPPPLVLAEAVHLLARCRRDPRANEHLLQFAQHPNARLSTLAVRYLGWNRNVRAIPWLLTIAETSGDRNQRIAAIDALGELSAGEAVPILEVLRSADDFRTRRAAKRALARIGS